MVLSFSACFSVFQFKISTFSYIAMFPQTNKTNKRKYNNVNL